MPGGQAVWLLPITAVTRDKRTPPPYPCTNPAVSHEIYSDTSKNTKEQPTANLCSDIWPTASYGCGGTTAELVQRPWSSRCPWLEVTTHRLKCPHHFPAPSPSRLGGWQVKPTQQDLQGRCICSARVHGLAVSAQSLATSASGRLLPSPSTSPSTINLIFNNQPHLQPLSSALPHLQCHLQSHLQPHLLPFFLMLHIRRHNSR